LLRDFGGPARKEWRSVQNRPGAGYLLPVTELYRYSRIPPE